mmetsp:Transcript_66689/g.168196  ORF Transcript_66689/g.168196 Transcript_66689/m.168196 type:complete len:210 (+) Transcript_66689:89-718(+)
MADPTMIPKVDVLQPLDFRPSKGAYAGDHWLASGRVHETTYERANEGALEALQSVRPKTRFPLQPTSPGRNGSVSARGRPGGSLANTGRAALGLAAAAASTPRGTAAEGNVGLVSTPKVSPACGACWGGSRVAQLFGSIPPSYSALSAPRAMASTVSRHTTYARSYEGGGGDSAREHEVEGNVDKTHHVKRNEMIEVARMQANMKSLMR